jgi:hypothetical protein
MKHLIHPISKKNIVKINKGYHIRTHHNKGEVIRGNSPLTYNDNIKIT